ncbi:DNA translocase FtsK [Alkalihalobacillus sp. AL-G]|uniref:DNA translocase FtsK n=1 Tax=Alkalihalobacillus sp. AL-G TaxID=2926399 RepID=UPI00272A795D|nr:DNA translocase FtsK [Alkalihalobacillus sp. AL-G]WLD92403.1 DNA translocase FtsK [Alkalihalobacillus sp. AL-G]
MSNWLRKMKDLLLESDHDELGDGNPDGETQSRPSSNPVGRIEDSNRSIKPKFVHQYPKEGNFRFPLIPDEKQTQKHTYGRTVRKQKQDSTTKKTPKQKTRKETTREKFTGINFKPSEIPSPIYGYGKRPEIFPPVLNREVEEEVLVVEEQDNMGIESSPEPFPLISDAHKQVRMEGHADNQFDESENGKVDAVNSEQAEIDGIQSNEINMKTLNYREQDECEEHFDPLYEEVDLAFSEETAATLVEENKSIDCHEEDQPVQPEKKESPIQRVRRYKELREKKDNGKTRIPFNVMMLQKDRQRRPSAETKKTETPKKEIGTSKPETPHKDVNGGYRFPTVNLLDSQPVQVENDELWLCEQKELLQSTLNNFNVKAHVIGATKGPSVTRIEVQPAPGVKVNKITNLADDIKLSLAAKDIRMEAPIPGRNAIGIEVPNKVSKPVTIREIVTDPIFKESRSTLSVALGLDISGKPVVTDLQKMPHGLIAGATGSGKSVCINSLLISILFKANPDEVRLLLIDPKMVELAPYNHLPHLVTPVITDAKEATMGLKWAVEEMERRYELFARTGVRDMERYNKLVLGKGTPDQKLPYIVVVIDELADLMMVSPQDVEDAICRIAQKARACGIHLLLATQRPSVDVITGLIKANIPTRVAFAVSSQVDSRTIIDMSGAEKLLGRGDMLFLGNGVSKPVRIQGNFVSDDEIERITEHVKRQKTTSYLFEKEELVQSSRSFEQDDELFDEAFEFVLEHGTASSSALQRRFRVGFNRAARLIDMMEAKGLVSEAMGSKPRNVLVTKQEYYNQTGDDVKQ